MESTAQQFVRVPGRSIGSLQSLVKLAFGIRSENAFFSLAFEKVVMNGLGEGTLKG